MATAPLPHLARPGVATSWNADYIDSLYQQWLREPESLAETWQTFFQGFELAMCDHKCVASDSSRKQSKVASLIYAYRSLGHRIAQTNPLGGNASEDPELALKDFDLDDKDLETVFDAGHLGGLSRASLKDIIAHLRNTYCEQIGVEYIHIQDRALRRWLQQEMEPNRNKPQFNAEQKSDFVQNLVDAELFETFLHSRYRGQKRFSLEGAETLIPSFHHLVEIAPEYGVEELVVGMAHRGRLNVLANILDKSYADIFGEFEDSFIPDSVGGDSDVKYHKGYSSDHVNRQGHSLHIALSANPSHLEAIDPVVEGKARAKQRQRGDTETREKVLPFLIHGDAAFAGQGIVAETFNLSQLAGYHTGGTIHFIINNQIGFTATPDESRSTVYATDVAKIVEAPIFHVNGDDPEACAYVTELALKFRQKFHRDVVIDMICYRRHGHNESDEPAFTQPLMYKKIRVHPTVRNIYIDRLVSEGSLSATEAQQIAEDFRQALQGSFEQVKEQSKQAQPVPQNRGFTHRWAKLAESYKHDLIETGIGHERVIGIGEGLCRVPDDFHLNPKIQRQLQQRLEILQQGGLVDWGFAELLAFGSLLTENKAVRLSGQDSARGTFSHRHSVWLDVENQNQHKALNFLRPGQEHFCVYNSSLSEAGVLGFDYGYSLSEPNMLIIWEAQFGDFANGAQVIIDQFILAAGSKWNRHSGLVMLLPHGYEGMGPEHSNAYLERYLAGCAQNNVQVCNFTTPAQYFHALRRQLHQTFRRPLIVMAPKSLLRHKACRSALGDFEQGHFQEILDDPRQPENARRVLLCSGKVYYDLEQARVESGREDIAIVRIEQLYPLNDKSLVSILAQYKQATDFVWVQEEPENRGAWRFIQARLQKLIGDTKLRYLGRSAAASPAVGSLSVHKKEQQKIMQDAININ